MARMLVVAILSGLLPACAGGPDWSRLIAGKPGQSAAAHYSFAWRLSGDRAVAPLQVFDNGRQTWLQFAPRQALPAVFEHTAGGDRPLGYTHEGPYMVLGGVWPELLLRGGHLKALVERLDGPPHEAAIAMPLAPAAGAPASAANTPAQAIGAPAQLAAMPAPAMPESPAQVAPASRLAAASFDPARMAAPPVPPAGGRQSPSLSQSPQSPQWPEPQRYEVSPRDLNLRSALARWARAAGWTFEPEHWAVDADIPIAGSATFEPGFKSAVRELLASTELSDRPLQPCFYSNRVLRIVPYAQPCDRTAGAAGSP